MLLGIDRPSATVHIGFMDVGVCGGPYSRRQPPAFRSATRVRPIETSVVALRLGVPDSHALGCAARQRPQSCDHAEAERSHLAHQSSEGGADCGDIGIPLGQGRLGSHTPAIFVTAANHELDMRPALTPAQIRAVRVGCDLTQLRVGEVLGGPTDLLARIRSRYPSSRIRNVLDTLNALVL